MKEDEVFYISVFCEEKCAYEVLVKLEDEHEIEIGSLYRAWILKDDELSFKIKVNRNFEELDIVAFSPTLGPFKLLVKEKERPTTENSIKVIPSWMGGYTVNIQKTSEYYCNDCYYYLVLEAGSTNAEIFFFAKYEETVTLIGTEEPVYNTLLPFKKHCYKYNVDIRNRDKNIIIQTVVFSGSVELKYKMNGAPDMANTLSDMLSNDIQTEKYIKISSTERSPNYGELNFCLKTIENSSYMVKAFYEDDIERYQHLNFLFRNREVNGYLPPGKATRYRVVEFNYESDITISMKVKNGDPKLYGFICDDITKCIFNKDEIAQQKYSGNLIPYQEFSIGYKVSIANSINTCHRRIKTQAENAKGMEDLNIMCATLAVVYCEGEDECEFSLNSYNDEVNLQLLPKRPHYQTIPYNETDYYSIQIDDSSITQLNIILNTITGDADLIVEFSDENADYQGFSSRESYLPDVIRIDKERLNKDNLIGLYKIKVFGNSFSSYSIYYYTKSEDNSNLPKITMGIESGHIIKDIYEPGTEYKIYSYHSNSYDELDIRITLTPEKDDYSLYVFTDLKKFKYDSSENYWRVSGYTWTDNFSNEIVIGKKDPNYKKGATYYIVVTEASYSKTPMEYVPKFWLGVTNEDTPFLLYEGVPNTVTLDNAYESQTYWYTHGLLTEPFGVSINVYFGKVNVYIDFQEIDETKLESASIRYLGTETTYIKVDTDTLKSKCNSTNNCQIYILIQKSSIFDAQYLISAKSHPSLAEFLPPDIIKTDTVLSGECRYYNILTDNKISNAIFVTFLSGYGDLYIKVPKQVLPTSKAIFPSPNDYEYKGADYYLGKTINLNSDNLLENCNPCQILATVCGNYLGYSEDDIEYNISFYNQAKKIDQNQPLRGNIKQGEIQYFSLYFSKNAENLYISVTNLMGDVDLFMNYGLDFPSFDNATWTSATPYNEFIEFDKEDNYFVARNLPDVSGNYTIMLYGAANSSYTLYATSHPKKIIAVTEGATASCKSDDKEPCYFRYNDFVRDLTQDVDIVITTDYLYGLGSIYANIYENANYEIVDNLPSSKKSDYSNKFDTTQNILKVKISKNNDKFNINSMMLIAVECKEKCFFELNVANMFKGDLKYLDVNRENIFYIYKSDVKTILIYYNWSEKDLNLAAYSYKGMGNFRVYLNNTVYDDQGNNKVEIVELKKFSLDNANNPTYHNTITNKNGELAYRNIFFEVDPLQDLGFYIKLTNDKDWAQIKINKVNTFSVDSTQKSFFGYFDLLNEYENTVVTVRSLTDKVTGVVFLKYLMLDKSYENFDLNAGPTFDSPRASADYTGTTDAVLQSFTAKIPKLPNKKTGNKFTRVLVQLQLLNYSKIVHNNIKFDITVTTNVEGTSIVEAEPEKLIFTQIDHKNENEIKIFRLKKKQPADNMLVLEISTCKGSIEYKLCNRMILDKSDKCNIIFHHENTDGRKLITLDLIKYPSENFYLSIWHKNQQAKDCRLIDGQNYACVDKSEATIYYMTTTKKAYKSSFATNKGALVFDSFSRDTIELKWGQMASESEDSTISTSSASYLVYVSQDTFDYEHMDSICYLSRLKQTTGKVEITMNKEGSALISKLEGKEKYYINVIAKNLETNEIIAYKPIEVEFEPASLPVYLLGKNLIIDIFLF